MTSVSPRRERGRGRRATPLEAAARREEMRRRILRESLELFARDGFQATTVRMIARRCGVTDALLYYYFRSKRDILAALWDIPQSRILHKVDPSRPLTVDRLMELVDQMVLASGDMNAIIRLMIRQALSGDSAARAFRQRTMDAWRRDVRAHFLTVLEAEEAELNSRLLTLIVFGLTFPAQTRAGEDYPQVARSPEFQGEVRELLMVGLPFCRERAGQL